MIVTALVTLTTANMDIVYRDMVTGAHQVNSQQNCCQEKRLLMKPIESNMVSSSGVGNSSTANHGSSRRYQERHGHPGEE